MLDPSVKGNRVHADPSAAGGYITEIEPPEDLSEEGLHYWNLITPELVAGRVLRADDIPLLVECCEAWAFVRTFRKALRDALDRYEQALALPAPQGDLEAMKAHDALLEMRSAEVKRTRAGWTQAYKAALSASGDLGLGPVARVRLGLAKVQGASLLGQIAQGAGGGNA
jgi:phage terminase small subunit